MHRTWCFNYWVHSSWACKEPDSQNMALYRIGYKIHDAVRIWSTKHDALTNWMHKTWRCDELGAQYMALVTNLLDAQDMAL